METIMSEKKMLDKFLSLKCPNEMDWEELEHSISLLQDNFIYRLYKKFPMLSKDDIRIVLLMRINMQNVDIAKLLHILPSSFRMRRCRLKKKMNISCKSLSEFIKNLF